MPRNRSGLVVLAAMLAMPAYACGPRTYGYAPVTNTSAQVSGHLAAELAFPPDSPHGNVRLATLGLTQASGGGTRSIHVRMVAENRGREPWIVDKREQELAVAVGDAARATVVRADIVQPRGAPDRVEVRPGETATIDLFFPLPPGAQGARDVPAFDAVWVVRAGSRAVATRTPFERFAASPAQNVPTAAYPYTPRTRRERLPGTPDSRWPADDPILMPDAVPRAPLP